MNSVPLVLLPGLLCDSALWEAQCRYFAPSRPVAVADLTQHDSVAALAATVLASAPDQFALCGLSMGGYVALEIMRQAPARVSRLALMDTTARPDSPEAMRRRRGLIAQSRIGTFKGVTPRLLKDLIHPDHLDGPVADTVMAMAARIGRDAFVRQQTAIINRTDSRPFLPAINVPTMVMVGAHDKLTPVNVAAEMEASIPQASLKIIADAGHLPPLEQPDAVNSALETWLFG